MYRLKTIASIVAAGAVVAISTAGTGAYSTSAYKWASFPVPFYVNPSNADVSNSAATSALQAGMEAWNTQPGTPFRFSYAGQVNDTSTSVDHRNVIIFRNTSNPDSPSAIATTYSWSQNGSRIDSDIIFWDGKYKFFTGSSGCAYTNGQYGVFIEDVATHELGHSLGLNHSGVANATMYPTYEQCTTSFRVLSDDDIAGIRALYGTGNAPSNSAPSLSISAPTNGSSVPSGTPLTFTGTASDSQDGALTGRIAWSSSKDGALGNGSGFTKTLTAGSHTITATVTDNGGLTSSKQVSVTVSTTNSAPSLSILSPTNGASVFDGTAVTLSGSASDSQDGSLTGRIAWSSSLDGSLGTGTGLSKYLSLGSHVITASVTDNGGLTSTRTVSVTVITPSAPAPEPAPAPAGAKLNAKGYKVKGSQVADLSWTDLSATSVDVYRGSMKIITMANTGKHTDNIGQKGGGSYNYKVCAAGTTNCSNQANVSF